MTTRVAYVTTNRSDYGPVHWLLRELADDARFTLQLIVGGAHLGVSGTVAEIEADGFGIVARVPFADDDFGTASAAALAGFSAAFHSARPDLVLLYGDRWELLPIANAAMLAGIPIAHLCGGDITEGALDDQVRHALTKLGHLHFATSARSAARIRQMGEEAWRVHEVGDPSLDRFRRGRPARADELTALLGFTPDRETVLVTFHPPTLAADDLAAQVEALVAALHVHRGGVVITAPAPDPGCDVVRMRLETLARIRPRTVFLESLGSDRYRGLMGLVGAMVGNSSSGLSEAPCVPLPAVNIGDRQAGRDRTRNVIDVPPNARAISGAISEALTPGFRAGLAGITSPYGDGHAAERIVAVLADLPAREILLRKRFAEPTSVTVSNARPIGGDFALDPSWLFDDDSGWFATARDAMAAIAAPRGGRWLVPEFMCRVVADALRAIGAAVEPYGWLTPWHVDETDLQQRLIGASGVIVPFHMGLPPSDAVWRALDGGGLVVVEDRAQCVGVPPPPDQLRGDYAVGSLRKWMAVPDGGWCVARRGLPPRPTATAALDMVALRAAAGLTRATWLRSNASDDTLERVAVELFARGEAGAAAPAAGRHASRFAARCLAEVDMADVVRRRVANQRALVQRLATRHAVELWEPSPGAMAATDLPLLALPVLCRDRDRLRAHLAQHRIFCAVHWTDGNWSGVSERAADWSRRTLSLPIDQRLAESDLDRMVELIER